MNGKKDHAAASAGTRLDRGWIAGAVLILLASCIMLGMPPSYRIGALFIALAVIPVVLFRNLWWWITEAVLIGIALLLLAFGNSGYRYASLAPIALALMAAVIRFGKRSLKVVFFSVFSVGLLALLLVELPILRTPGKKSGASPDYVIVLGAAVYGEEPSLSLLHRTERAIKYLKANPSAKAVVSGGRGEGESISEAECMKRILLKKGIKADRILIEDQSTSTMENLVFSKAVIEADGADPSRVAVVSSSYHLYRVSEMAKSLGMECTALASVDGYPVYMSGMYFREALGVIKMWLFGSFEKEASYALLYVRASVR